MNYFNSRLYEADLDACLDSTIGIEKMRGAAVLVTGATGTIGSFLVDALLRYNERAAADVTVYAAGRSLERLCDRFQGIRTDKLILAEYDVTKDVSFDFDVDYIIHCAGNAFPAAFLSQPVATIIGSVNGTYMLLEYGRNCKSRRFLYVSSGEVYGQGDLNLEEFQEDYSGYVNPVALRSCYPMGKRAAENLCVSYFMQYSLETVIARPCHTYGPGFTPNDNRANAQFFRSAQNGEDIVLTSEGRQLRSYCYVADCASALLTILTSGESGEAYNCANPNSRATIAELARAIADAAGRKVRFDIRKEHLVNQTPIIKQVLCSRKLEGLGWSGRYSITEGVRHTLEILGEE